MKRHIGPDENVLNYVESIFELKSGEAMPELLSEFITLLDKEKEEWGGVKAMRECLEVYFRWKEEQNHSKATCEDFESFLYSPDRNVIVIQGGQGSVPSKAVIQGVVDSPANPEKWKGGEGSVTSKAVIQGFTDPPANRETWQEPDRPSSSKTVNQDLPKDSNTSKETDNPSSNKAVIPATKKKTLKVKIYMGTGWDKYFTKRDSGSSPDLFVNVTINGGKIQKTTVPKSSWTPSWEEEFVFPLSSLENDVLVVELHEDTPRIREDKFVGTFRLQVSTLKPGIQVIPRSFEVGKPCSTARLLMVVFLVCVV